MSNSPHAHPRQAAVPSPFGPVAAPPADAEAGLAALPAILQVLQATAAAVATLPERIAAATPRPPCAMCAMERADWADANEAAITAAQEQVQAAQEQFRRALEDQIAGTGGPAPVQPPNLTDLLPPGIAPVYPSVTRAGGTDMCEQHLAVNARATREHRVQQAAVLEAAQGGAPQRRPILLAHTSDVHAVAREAMAFGMPGQ